MEWILQPILYVAEFPFLAFVIAIELAVLLTHSFMHVRRGWSGPGFLLALPIVLWALYGIYEYGRTASDAIFRTDLLVIAPILYITTAAGVCSWAASLRHQSVS